MASKLPKGKQRNFGKAFMKYFKKTWINGSYEPKSWNFWGHNGATTNNYNEGYNNKFNNSLNLHGHPNPYTLCKVIKDELLNAENDDRAAKVKPNTKAAASRAGKRTQLLERKQYLMNCLAEILAYCCCVTVVPCCLLEALLLL